MLRYGDPDQINNIVRRGLRRRAIGTSFLGLLGSAFWACLCVWLELGSPFLAWFVAPACFLPALIAGALLAQHLDRRDGAAWLIAAPTVIAMLLITGFTKFLFVYSKAWNLRGTLSMAVIFILLGGSILLAYLLAFRIARRRGNG